MDQRIAELRLRYAENFERQLDAPTSLKCYEYLDILDQLWSDSAQPIPRGGVLYDVGCASFWYATVLQAFFRPTRLVGVDVEGHRLYRDGRTRIDYARGFLESLPHGEFRVADYSQVHEPADVLTAWFPFLTDTAILAWRLPLSLLAPGRLFCQIRRNLNPDGVFVMVNHGHQEATTARQLCTAAGLIQVAQSDHSGDLSAYRAFAPVASIWRRRLV